MCYMKGVGEEGGGGDGLQLIAELCVQKLGPT